MAHDGVEPSVGSVGDSYDDAFVETLSDLYKTGVIPPWRNLGAALFAEVEWAGWFNNRCLLEPVGNSPDRGRNPTDAEARLVLLGSGLPAQLPLSSAVR